MWCFFLQFFLKNNYNIIDPSFERRDYMIMLNIKEILKRKGKTKYWLVKNLETGYQAVDAMMNNKTSGIRFKTIEKLCKVLDCTPIDLFKIK